MKSSIKIELVPVSGGGSLEPVIKVKISSDTSDIRDYSLKTFFDSQGYDSNALIVRRMGVSDGGGISDLEIYPLSNTLLDYLPDHREGGINIGENTEELRFFLEKLPHISWSTDGENIVIYDVNNAFTFGALYGQHLQRLGKDYSGTIKHNDPNRVYPADPS